MAIGRPPLGSRILDEPLLTPKEAASLIHVISESTLRSWVSQGRVPFRKVGGRLAFVRSELRQWIDSGCPGRAS